MAEKEWPSELSVWTDDSNETDPVAEQDSGVEDVEEEEGSDGACIPEQIFTMEEAEGQSLIFIAFKGNMADEDFQQKLDSVLNGIPQMLELGLFTCGMCVISSHLTSLTLDP